MKKILMLLIMVMIFSLSSCTNKNTNPLVDEIVTVNVMATETVTIQSEELLVEGYRKITAEEARLMMEDNENFILLDVRSEEEFKENRIKGAVLIPYTEITERIETEFSDKNALILVYCRSGRRSAIAANELVLLGYTNVYDFGGIIEWPYEAVSG